MVLSNQDRKPAAAMKRNVMRRTTRIDDVIEPCRDGQADFK